MALSHGEAGRLPLPSPCPPGTRGQLVWALSKAVICHQALENMHVYLFRP
jgi:hypothetical protein